MNDDAHLTELEIYEATLEEGSSDRVAEHVEKCARCAAAVEDMRDLHASLAALGPELHVPGGLEARLMRRIRTPASAAKKPGSASEGTTIRGWLLRAAAALILFASGVVTHATWSGSDAVDFRAEVSAPLAEPALALQRAGTEYVAAIARLVADSARLSEAERRRGREVALAAMSGAAFELRLLTGESEEAAEIHRVASRARFPEDQPVVP